MQWCTCKCFVPVNGAPWVFLKHPKDYPKRNWEHHIIWFILNIFTHPTINHNSILWLVNLVLVKDDLWKISYETCNLKFSNSNSRFSLGYCSCWVRRPFKQFSLLVEFPWNPSTSVVCPLDPREVNYPSECIVLLIDIMLSTDIFGFSTRLLSLSRIVLRI